MSAGHLLVRLLSHQATHRETWLQPLLWQLINGFVFRPNWTCWSSEQLTQLMPAISIRLQSQFSRHWSASVAWLASALRYYS
jgi:hypothetical protein